MPHSSLSNNRKRAPLRRCATCDKVGHNARTCTYGKATEVSPISVIEKQQKSVKKASVVIPVVKAEPPTSPHVVSLKNEERDRRWNEISVYQPEKEMHARRVSVDFAQMVRVANQSSEKKNIDRVTVPKQSTVDLFREKIQFPMIERDIPMTIDPSRISKKVVPEESVRIQPTQSYYVPIEETRARISLREEVVERGRMFADSFRIKKFVLSVAVLALLALLPFPAVGWYRKVEEDTNRIIAESTNAFLSLQSSTVAAFNQNLPQAQYDLNQALNSFGTAQTMVDKEYKALTYVLDMVPVVGTKIKSRQELLEAGQYLALGNAYLIKGISAATTEGDDTTADRLQVLRTHIRGALPQYERAVERLDSVAPESVPVEYQESFVEFRKLFHLLVRDITNVADVIGGLELILGSDGFKRYLLVFQNQYELRPTGGFIGSFATLDVQSGKILHIDIPGGGSYDLQGQLSVYLRPPLPLQLINKRWEFQDANWFPDWTASAKKLASLYEKSRGTTVDGVIAVNASVLERLLRIVGPLESAEYDTLFDSENAIKNLMYEIETYDNEDDANTPKAVLSVLLGQITEMMKNLGPEQLISMVTELSDALDEREIQAYFTDSRVASTIRSYGWSGEILASGENQDYLMVVNTNIGGGKSDANMTQTIEHQAEITADGSIIDTVVITRTHQGGDSTSTLLGQMNSSYIRVYVPEGAELIDAGGFVYPDDSSFNIAPSWYEDDADLASLEVEQSIHSGSGTRIVKEFGKTSFGNWIVTYPEKQTRVYFTYKLPFKAFDSSREQEEGVKAYVQRMIDTTYNTTSQYSIIFQKQSGINSELIHTVIYPEGWRPMWKTGDMIDVSLNGASLHGILSRDTVYGIIMKQE